MFAVNVEHGILHLSGPACVTKCSSHHSLWQGTWLVFCSLKSNNTILNAGMSPSEWCGYTNYIFWVIYSKIIIYLVFNCLLKYAEGGKVNNEYIYIKYVLNID